MKFDAELKVTRTLLSWATILLLVLKLRLLMTGCSLNLASKQYIMWAVMLTIKHTIDIITTMATMMVMLRVDWKADLLTCAGALVFTDILMSHSVRHFLRYFGGATWGVFGVKWFLRNVSDALSRIITFVLMQVSMAPGTRYWKHMNRKIL